MRILWATDIHLNFLRTPRSARIFGEYLSVEEFDVLVVTGDIAEAPSVRELLSLFAKGVGKPIYFVLGNHDYYKGSIADVERDMSVPTDPNLVWLDKAPEPILLDPDTALVGQGGWYDGQLGDPMRSRVLMSADFKLIHDFIPYYNERFWLYEQGGRTDLLAKLRTLSKQHAEAAKVKLLAALKLRKQVIFATHYPPFSGASWHEGALSDQHWLPWFSSGYMGEMLGDVAADHPDHRILVLCGHTHSPGMYEHLPNLLVLTGKAVYRAPDVAGVLELPLQHWTGKPDRCDRCDDQDFEVTTTQITCNTCQLVWVRGNGPWVQQPD